MQCKIFTIPIVGGNMQEEEFNIFLRSNKIVSIDKHFSETIASWSFCVTYIENSQQNPYSSQYKKEKIDYREILDEQAFARFTRLREVRKKIATDDGVPAYAIFTNEELSVIACLEDLTEQNIANIKGIGEKRMEKYGKRFLGLYNTLQ